MIQSATKFYLRIIAVFYFLYTSNMCSESQISEHVQAIFTTKNFYSNKKLYCSVNYFYILKHTFLHYLNFSVMVVCNLMDQLCSPLIVGNLSFSITPSFQKMLAFLKKIKGLIVLSKRPFGTILAKIQFCGHFRALRPPPLPNRAECDQEI